MKAVFVLGFYDPVRAALDAAHPERMRDGTLTWIGQRPRGRDREVNLNAFSAEYRARKGAGMKNALILVATLRGRDYVVDAVRSIVASANEDSKISYELIAFENTGDRDGVLDRIANFQLVPPSGPSCDAVRKKIPQGKILCVSLDGSTSVLDALRRAGLSDQIITTFFEEERIKGARNSGLMEHLGECANRYVGLLYSFTGLRTLSADTKQKFGTCFEAPSAAKLAQLARKWLEGE